MQQIFMQTKSTKHFMQLQFYFSTRPCTEKKVFSGRGRLESGLLTTTVAVARNVAATDVTYMRERGQ